MVRSNQWKVPRPRRRKDELSIDVLSTSKLIRGSQIIHHQKRRRNFWTQVLNRCWDTDLWIIYREVPQRDTIQGKRDKKPRDSIDEAIVITIEVQDGWKLIRLTSTCKRENNLQHALKYLKAKKLTRKEHPLTEPLNLIIQEPNHRKRHLNKRT